MLEIKIIHPDNVRKSIKEKNFEYFFTSVLNPNVEQKKAFSTREFHKEQETNKDRFENRQFFNSKQIHISKHQDLLDIGDVVEITIIDESNPLSDLHTTWGYEVIKYDSISLMMELSEFNVELKTK